MNEPELHLWRDSHVLHVLIPYHKNNRQALRVLTNARKSNVVWDKTNGYWTIPKAHLATLRDAFVDHYGACIVKVQAGKTPGKCHEVCQNAVGPECECSCVGAFHGISANKQVTLGSGVILTWDDAPTDGWVIRRYRKEAV